MRPNACEIPRALQAKGLDGFLLQLMQSWWGCTLVLLVAVGLGIFAVCSFLEARFHQASAGA